MIVLLYTFPFEGNWNTVPTGIETVVSPLLAIHFPVWRELKHYTPSKKTVREMRSCYTLSRLKGIETVLFLHFRCEPLDLLYTFPFEGNWNFLSFIGIFSFLSCYTLSRLKGIETFPGPVLWGDCAPCYTLSRLKGIETMCQEATSVLRLLLAIHFPVWRELKQKSEHMGEVALFACYTLSRLKGIETY